MLKGYFKEGFFQAGFFHEGFFESDQGDIFGVEYNQTADNYTRIGTTALISVPVSTAPGNALVPIQALMKRCVLNDAGVLQYLLDADDSTLKADGTASDLTGGDGQVLVKIPKFYYRYTILIDGYRWEISLSHLSGFKIHPAFIKGGVEVSHRYFGAYEAWTDGSTKLTSVSGQLPTVSQIIGTFRTRAEARGTGWHLQDFYLTSAVQLLYLIEYADFNSQAMIGAGITDYETWPGGPQALTGNANPIGNATGNNTLAVDKWNADTVYSLDTEATPEAAQTGYTYKVIAEGTSAALEPGTWPTVIGDTVVDNTVTWECVRHSGYMSYRGIENWYGHVWKFVDGISVHNSSANGSRAWLAQNYTDYASDTETGYTLATSSLSQADGYARTIVPIDDGFLPLSTSGGSSSTGLADYYSTYYDNDNDSGWRVVRLGGRVVSGTTAGAFYWHSYNASSVTSSSIGGRLAF